jgi:hypothetical protein
MAKYGGWGLDLSRWWRIRSVVGTFHKSLAKNGPTVLLYLWLHNNDLSHPLRGRIHPQVPDLPGMCCLIESGCGQY